MGNIEWSFGGKVVVITGVSRGIGLATANLFASAGAEVFGISRSDVPKELVREVRPIECDVASATAVTAAIDTITHHASRIDICIANAGVGLVEAFESTPEHDWQRVIDVNLLGVMRIWRAAISHMGAGGRLIANSSAAGVRGEPATPAYCASKASLTGLVQSLAVQYARRGITVNAVAPGEVDTRMNHDNRDVIARSIGQPADVLLAELVTQHIPVGRLGSPDDVASLIAYLASAEAAYITGQTLLVDGGQLLI
jgi:meso-butanediol dehydrogenase/(S,S)-butanediol dehydrogenase/diacetyl reductase